MYHKRNLCFSIIFTSESSPKVKDLKFGVASESEDEIAQNGVTLASCFNGYEKKETLSGNDQWYCRKCKEHRDINKKLELFKVPKIMILQLKRFSSKERSGSSGKSGYLNLAYAQIMS